MTKKQIWISPKFHKILKSKAAKEGLSVLEYTRKVANSPDSDIKKELKVNKFWSKLI